jgi:CRP-like cAMP-binding protein
MFIDRQRRYSMTNDQRLRHLDNASYIKGILTQTFLFSHMDEDVLNAFSSSSSIKHVKKGHVLFISEEEASCFYVIKNGWIKLFRESLDGNEAVVDVLNKNHIFGDTSMFENDTYPYSAEVVEDAELVMIPIAMLKKQIERHAPLSLKMLHAMSRFRKQQDIELEHRDLQNAPQRIGCFLLRLCKQNAEGPILLQLPYDKTLLAARLGMKPETFSRALARLRNETGIVINGSNIELKNIEQLSSYSCSACSSTYPCQDLH